MKRYKVCLIFFVLMAVIFVVCGSLSVGADEEKTRTVRVAYPIQEGITDYDELGKHSGYTYEYLEEIAQYTGWNYEFVTPSGNTNEGLVSLMEQLKNGEIDLMGAMVYSEELEKEYDYSSYSYGVGETVLRALHESEKKIVVNSQVEQTFKIAILKTSQKRKEELEEYCRYNLIIPEYVLCDTPEKQIEALHDGRADMMLDSSMNRVDGMRIIASFSNKPFYFVTTKNKNVELMNELNEAILNIEQAFPYFQDELHEKYFASANDELILTQAEIEFAKNSPTIRVGYVSDQAPYQYTQDGLPTGISIDLLEYISSKTNLKFE